MSAHFADSDMAELSDLTQNLSGLCMVYHVPSLAFEYQDDQAMDTVSAYRGCFFSGISRSNLFIHTASDYIQMRVIK